MINHSDQISNLAAALLKAQQAIGHALKSADNPYYKSRYADLTVVIESVKEPLNSNGITFLQAVDENSEGRPVVDTILLHESGQYLSTRTPVFCKKPDDPQAFGSGVTYSKRYALQAILGLPTEDDDAEGAMARNRKQGDKEPAKYKKSTKKKEDPAIDKIIEQAWYNFQTVNADKMPEGKVFKEEYFKKELRNVFIHLKPAKKKAFVWNQENTDKLAEAILLANCLTDIKVEPDA